MQLRHLLLASLVSIAACGGGNKPAPVEPAPVTTTEPATPPAEPAATPPVAEKAPEPAPPPAPKLVLGEAKIVLKAAKKTEASGEVTLAADGTMTAKMTSSKKKENKTVTAKLSAEGELTDDKGEVIARLGDGGKVEARHVSETKENGKTVKSEATYREVGTLDDTGTFTIKKDGKTITIDDKGKVVGGPPDATITVTAAPEQRKAAMFVVVAMFAASKVTMDSTSSKVDTVPVTPQK